MAKRNNKTALTPNCESLKVINTNSVIISRNNNGRKINKTQKSHKNLLTSNIASTELPRLRNCTLKLKRFKMPPLASASDHFGDVSKAPMQVARSPPSTTKKCRIRLSRTNYSPEQDSLLQATAVQNSPPRTHRLRSNKNKENARNNVNRVIQPRALRKLGRENQNDIKNNQNPLLCVDVAFKSSTPLKPTASFQREPFKVLDLQKVICEVDPADHVQQIIKMQPIITKENRESLRKLSLSRSKNPQELRKHNKIVHFEPLRNSTLYAVDIPSNTTNVMENCAKNLLISCQLDDTAMESENIPEKSDVDKRDEHSREKSQSSSKNLANRSDLIEQLLLSDNDEEQSIVDQHPHQNETPAASKTNKFFHRTLETSKNPNKPLITKKQPVKKTRLSRKKRLSQRGKKSVGSVYEFLSQSQTSGSDTATKKLDPAADVIKKLIAEGKVRVATHKMGSGKLRIKRTKIPRKRGVVQRKNPTKKNIKKAAENGDVEPYVDIDDMLHEGFEEPQIPEELEPTVAEASATPASKKSQDTSAGGDTFSNLARTVLISETKKKENSRNKITYQRKLLEAAQKFVSTPLRERGPPLDKTANMSPIMPQGAPRTEESGASPWRVDDDEHLPSVFYFSRNSANLPSFSSDYIPSSPKKQKHRYQDLLPEPEVHEPAIPLNNGYDSQLPIIPITGTELSKNSSSSFSSNDSNAENKPPVASVINPSNSPGSENLNLTDQRQQLNPQRELSNRSPLQILDVISLPPWNSSKQQYTIEKKYQKASNNNTSLPNQQIKGNISDLFGFEEFLQDDTVEAGQEKPAEITEISNNTSFRNKLHDLKHLRPTQKKIPQSLSSNQIADVFNICDGQSGSRQLQIKEMLCSTMISHGKGKEKSPMKRSNRINKKDAGTKKSTNEPSELFIDPDPGTSFNEKDSLRTYIRPYKRKRKLRHNFVMFLDSDESGDDDDEAHKKNNSDTSKELEVGHKKKKNKKEQKDNVEFDSFMNEFNDMCKEVDKYQLITE